MGVERVHEHDGRVGLYVFVADAYGDHAESLALLLGPDGHTVRASRDGPGTIRAAAESPDVVVLEVSQAGLDGREGVRRPAAGRPGSMGAPPKRVRRRCSKSDVDGGAEGSGALRLTRLMNVIARPAA